jgi:hypothetical protein
MSTGGNGTRLYSIAVLMESLNMHTIQKILVVSSLSLLLPCVASAQSISEMRAMSHEDRRSYMQSMSEDERAAKREQWRSDFDALPAQEQQAIRNQRAERRDGKGRNRDREAMRERWESMSDEERAAAKDRRRGRDDQRRARWESMNDEEKAAARARRDEHRAERGGRHGKQRNHERPDTDQPEG